MIETWHDFSASKGPLVGGRDGRYTVGNDLCVLLTLAVRQKPAQKRILEMYCAWGDTAVNLATACPEARVFAFDSSREMGGWTAPVESSVALLPLANVGQAIIGARGDVRERIAFTVAKAEDLPGLVRLSAPYDMAWIDGNHTWECVLRDTALALEVARPEGVLVWDDYWKHCPDVMEAIDRMNDLTGNRITLVQGTRVCYLHLSESLRLGLSGAVEKLRAIPRFG